MNRPDWDQYWMSEAYMNASRSTDKSTHAGTVIVRPDNSVASAGYNGPVRGMAPEAVPQTRPEKYLYMEHSERNAIYIAAKHGISLEGCTLYVNFLPCADCARAIVQSGITEVVVHREGQDAFNEASGIDGDEWDGSHQASLAIFQKDGPDIISTWKLSSGNLEFERQEATETMAVQGYEFKEETEEGIMYFSKPNTILRWWSGKLWQPTGFFRGQEFNL